MNALPEPVAAVPAGEPALSAWERFITARASDVFCEAWLALVCERFPTLRHAAVLVETADGKSYAPIAVWPAADADMSRMSDAAGKCLGEKRVVAAPAADTPGHSHLAIPLLANERVAGTVVFEMVNDAATVPALLREVHWGSAWLTQLLGRREHDLAVEASERSAGIVHTLAVSLRHARFQQALFDLCNELRRRFAATRVAVGLVRDTDVRLAALSEAATFETSSPLVHAYRDAMAEALDLAQVVQTDGDAGGLRAHGELLRRTGSTHALTLPVVYQQRTIAMLSLEREAAFEPAERRWLETFADLLAPVAEQRTLAERGSLARMADEARRAWAAVVGPRHLVWKAVAVLLALVALALVVVPVDYRVSAKTVTEGEVQRVAAAPFEGFLAEGLVRAGDTVSQGQPVARLDDHDLQVERIRWASERDQYDNKLREAMAQHDLSAIQVTGAQLAEAQAQLDLLDDKIARAIVRAPYDGVVVSGDLAQQAGTPVEAGKKLFEIAPLHSYRIILEVDERDMGPLREGQRGELMLNGMAGGAVPMRVAKVTPVATVKDGKNVYRVEARLESPQKQLLPGMEGVAKVDVGRRSLGWTLLHNAIDWLRLQAWSWGL